jgi:hypothetical protein
VLNAPVEDGLVSNNPAQRLGQTRRGRVRDNPQYSRNKEFGKNQTILPQVLGNVWLEGRDSNPPLRVNYSQQRISSVCKRNIVRYSPSVLSIRSPNLHDMILKKQTPKAFRRRRDLSWSNPRIEVGPVDARIGNRVRLSIPVNQ